MTNEPYDGPIKTKEAVDLIDSPAPAGLLADVAIAMIWSPSIVVVGGNPLQNAKKNARELRASLFLMVNRLAATA